MAPKILVIDNYDSFVYILVQYLGELGATPIVIRNDVATVTELVALKPDGVLISPGPGRPADAGVSIEAIQAFAGSVPVLGVCLGHQAIGELYGGTVIGAPQLMHGKTSDTEHNGTGVFTGLSSPVQTTRYHSLIVRAEDLPDSLEVTASTADGVIMGMRHRELEVEGVQFHPESVLTVGGKTMISNFLGRCGVPVA
ncbi:MAG: aminodeoxychorismate/anthranilate synthase component II [Acidimicrobiales bacterium]|nr:aminodeoxychorismate/anthranilate synthase component II [Acidimicrobiales bacterium]